ncbi:MAG TPA: Eco57I restriction-modification methylase domain-containing protein [Anaerolineae bacterium]|nr:Eco57I restriction-modification methylase domain-containing protein [Anaerolineae bacterium]
MPTPDLIHILVDRFRANLDSYKRGVYNETQVRREFIDPFFEALGWDVANRQGYAEAYKDVVHEDAIKVGGGTKAPDYGFRIGGVRKFFVEAKKPSVDVKGDPHPAFQLRRYAWSAKLPLSVLTDFEEFAAYDCRVRPDKGDKSGAARVLYVTFDQYGERWDEIAGVFSREAILRGAFDKYAEAKGGKRGTAEVDAAFLAEIERWRDGLARTIALRNPGLGQRELNFAVQQTIDRLIFLRICEDRGVEPYGSLLGLVNGAEVYQRLLLRFQHADARYNSGLFYFQAERGRGDAPDVVTPHLAIDDKLLREILKSLYYPDSPYEFSVLPADILGHVYEQFLGKVIRLTAGHRAVVEEKPEVRKAGGVFYTPTFIVDAIVRETLGRLVASAELPTLRKSWQLCGPGRRTPLRVADIACGSGTFLLGAYQFLLDWYLAAYLAEGADASRWATGRNPRLYQNSRGEWKLTVNERKRILLDHIYGVDIDPQAVEVTKLSLLLKVLEGEDEQTLGQQLALFPERALPDLARNIKCGNSLIGPDFFDGQQMALLDDEAALRVNVFDWQAEFPQVFADGGFDVLIGNPPYIRIQALKEWAPLEVEYYKRRYRAASKGNYDIYVVFVEQGLELLNAQGRLGYILPHKFFNAQYGQPLRGLIAEGQHLARVVHFGDQQVFAGATTYTCLLFLEKEPQPAFHFVKAHDLAAWRQGEAPVEGELAAERVTGAEWNFAVGDEGDPFERLKAMPVKLGDLAHIFVGTQTSADTVFVLEDAEFKDDLVSGISKLTETRVEVEADAVKPFLRGKEIRRYQPPTATSALICPYVIQDNNFNLIPETELAGKYPLAYRYLKSHKSILDARERGKFKGSNWYAFGYPKSMTLFQWRKIIVPDYNNVASFTMDEHSHFYKTGYGILVRDDVRESSLYILGLLNSPLLFRYLTRVSTMLRGGYVRFWTQYIEQLPIRTIDFTNPADVARHDRMVSLVERMLDLHKRLAAEQTPHVKTVLQRQIEATDRQIDALVYELYGLTEEEIAVVEGRE